MNRAYKKFLFKIPKLFFILYFFSILVGPLPISNISQVSLLSFLNEHPLASQNYDPYNITQDYIPDTALSTFLGNEENRNYTFINNNTFTIIHNGSLQLEYQSDQTLSNISLGLFLNNNRNNTECDLQIAPNFPKTPFSFSHSGEYEWKFGAVIRLELSTIYLGYGSIIIPISSFKNFGSLESKQIYLVSYAGNYYWRWQNVSINYSEKYISVDLFQLGNDWEYNDEKGTFVSYFTFVNTAVKIQPPSTLTPFNVPLLIIIIVIVGFLLLMTQTEFRQRITTYFHVNKGYHRLEIDEVFENDNRKRIIDEILTEPGIHYSELLRRCNLVGGQLDWHLEILKQYEIIKEATFGQYHIYYPAFEKNPLNHIDLTLLKSKILIEILKIIKDNPGISLSNISRLVHMQRNSIKYHTDKLLENNLIRSEKSGREIKLYLNSRFES